MHFYSGYFLKYKQNLTGFRISPSLAFGSQESFALLDWSKLDYIQYIIQSRKQCQPH